MTAVQFRNPEVRLSEALATTRHAIEGHQVTLRELLLLVGEQGLLVFCAILAMPFLLPVSLPFMSTALGVPMLLIGYAVTMNRVPWLPDRVLDHALPSATVQHTLERAVRTFDRFEHLVRPRMLGLTATPGVNTVHGIALVIAVIALMAPLPLIPLANTLPAIGVLLLCLGMAERDGALLLLGHLVTLVSVLYVGTLLYFAAKAGSDPRATFDMAMQLFWKFSSG
ncbi:MAG: exopolysaccharide biosynthesis protein [Steroidobacteraceae bacterium]|nr:exopolysaccharide biosynthesis protein [Steroidobacteraceae bacterium]MBP7014672.1 exopolysaccharide biosynthesis protein [Steroidobacteraceae bacterium]